MHQNVVVCLCIGTAYSDEYVHTLKRMVERHASTGCDFVCYSDRHIDGIATIQIEDPHRFEPVWYKLQLLTLPYLKQYTNKVYFDLDVVIHNNIDWLFAIQDPGLHVIRASWKTVSEVQSYNGTGCNTSIMAWKEYDEQAYSLFMQSPDKYMMLHKGIDRFLWNNSCAVRFLPDDQIYSYLHGASLADNQPTTMRKKMSVCVYNGHLKPSQALASEPAKSYWR